MTHKGKNYLTVKETMSRLEVSRTKLYDIIADGAFIRLGDMFKLRGTRYFSEEAIENYVESQIYAQ